MRDVLAPQQAKFEEIGQPSREAWLAMGEQGLLGISTPAEVGGIGRISMSRVYCHFLLQVILHLVCMKSVYFPWVLQAERSRNNQQQFQLN
jgi:alkylation response protein AidB-like acyl-CoA dehydrogenase